MIELDDINREILDLLQQNGRMSYRELGQRVGLTAPAVTERVHKLQELGVIKGFRAVLDYEALGFPILCVIRLNQTHGSSSLDLEDIDQTIADIPEIIEANRVTGSESHVVRARVRSTRHLEELLQHFWPYGDSVTNIVTSSPVPRRPMHLGRTLGSERSA